MGKFCIHPAQAGAGKPMNFFGYISILWAFQEAQSQENPIRCDDSGLSVSHERGMFPSMNGRLFRYCMAKNRPVEETLLDDAIPSQFQAD
jgi:hypothetical protein